MKTSAWKIAGRKGVVAFALTGLFTVSFAGCSTDEPEVPTMPGDEPTYQPEGSVLDKGGWQNNGKTLFIPKSMKELPPQYSNDLDYCHDVYIQPIEGYGYIIVDEENPNFSSEDGVLFNKDKTELILYPRSRGAKVYSVPSSVISISDYAFANNKILEKVRFEDNGNPYLPMVFGNGVFKKSTLKEIEFPDDFSKMGYDCFAGCENLTINFRIPKSMTTPCFKSAFEDGPTVNFIGCDEKNTVFSVKDNYVYDKRGETLICCPSLPAGVSTGTVDLKLPEGIKVIGFDAFILNKNDVKKIILPQSLERIDKFAFSGKIGKEITIPAKVKVQPMAFRDNKSITTVEFSEGTTTIAENSFYNCLNLSNVKFPNSLRTIENNAFKGCASIMKLVIPEGVKTIGERAFYDCHHLSEITLPSTLQKIDNQAFFINLYMGDGNFLYPFPRSYYCHMETPPAIESQTLYMEEATLYVPAKSVSLYENASEWSGFNSFGSNGIKPMP